MCLLLKCDRLTTNFSSLDVIFFSIKVYQTNFTVIFLKCSLISPFCEVNRKQTKVLPRWSRAITQLYKVGSQNIEFNRFLYFFFLSQSYSKVAAAKALSPTNHSEKMICSAGPIVLNINISSFCMVRE